MSWQALQDRYQAFNQREKLLIVLCALAVIYMIMQLLWLDPINAKHTQLSSELSSLSNTIQDLHTQQALLTQIMHQDPDQEIKQQIAQQKQTLQRLDRELNTLAVGMVPAQKLPNLLQDVLQQMAQLELLSVKTLPVTNLQLQEQQTVTDGATGGAATKGAGAQTLTETVNEDDLAIVNTGVYKHTVELTIRGSYFQVLAYLEALEGLAWRFYWQSLDYEVSDYPRAQVRLKVYTLSTEEGLFSG